MATEVIEIVIRERGAASTSRKVKGIGSSAKTAAASVGVLLTALGAFAAVRGFTNLITSSIRVSSEFEGLEVRLSNLLGSQEEANTALANFTELAAKTPFAVKGIVEGASTLAAAALNNREKLEELTATAANLAAVTGLSFQDAAGNLQRALSGGIGAADLFRERGVRALVEEINGIPDLTKVSLQELDTLFRDTFGGLGRFGSAAEDLSLTLGGALSNIGDAATNLQDAIGDVFAPAVIRAARELFIPFLTELEKLVRDNETEFRQLAAGGLKSALLFVVDLTRGALALAGAFAQAAQFARSVAVGILQLREALITAPAAAIDRFLGIEESQSVENLADIQRAIAQLEAEGADAQKGLDTLQETLDGIGAGLDRFEGGILSTDFANLPEVPGGVGAAGGPDASEVSGSGGTKEQEAALKRIEAITQRLVIANQQQIEPLTAQLTRLQAQRAELEKQAAIAGDRADITAGLAAVDAQIARSEAEKTTLQAEQAALLGRIADLSAEISDRAPEFAAELERAAQAAVDAGGGLEKVNAELRSVSKEGAAQLQRENAKLDAFSDRLGESFTSGISGALDDVLEGKAVSFSDIFASTLKDVTSTALDQMLTDLSNDLGDILSDIGGGAGGLGAGLGAALGIGGLLASSFLQEGDAQVTRAAQQSAVDSSQSLRGVVAGPTNVPIFQVGDSIADGFVGVEQLMQELVGLTREELATLRSIASLVGGGASTATAGSLLTSSAPGLGG